MIFKRKEHTYNIEYMIMNITIAHVIKNNNTEDDVHDDVCVLVMTKLMMNNNFFNRYLHK